MWTHLRPGAAAVVTERGGLPVGTPQCLGGQKIGSQGPPSYSSLILIGRCSDYPDYGKIGGVAVPVS